MADITAQKEQRALLPFRQTPISVPQATIAQVGRHIRFLAIQENIAQLISSLLQLETASMDTIAPKEVLQALRLYAQLAITAQLNRVFQFHAPLAHTPQV